MQVAEIEGLEFEVKGYSNAAINSLDKLTATLSKFKTLGSNFSGAIKKVSSSIKSLSESVTGSKFASGLKTFNSALTATIKSVASLTDKMGKMGLKGMGSLISLPFKQAVPKVVGFAKKLGGVVSGFKRILGYRIIRSVIREISDAFQEGIKRVYEWSRAVGGPVSASGMTFAETMNDIATSLGYFKGSIGAAVAPLLGALAPAIRTVTDAAVELINILNQLFAKLTGQSSWTRAIRKAEDYEDAVGGAGSAAKKALEYLAPFDELNVLPDPKSGGGGGGTPDYSDAFETVGEFSEGISTFADSIRSAIEGSDWQGLGVLLGDKVNGIVDSIDFAGFGSKVGGYINAWFTTRYWTLDTINFTNIGSKIAEFLNNALGEIDFETIGRSLVQKFEVFADTVIGFIEEADWGLIASSIADTVSGFFKEIGDWFTETDFATLADSIWNGIKDAVASVDWGNVASSIVSALGAAIGGIGYFFIQLGKDILTDIWTAIKNAAATWDDGDGELTGQEIINGIWEGIKNTVKNVGQWIKDNIFIPFITGFKEAFGIHSPADEMIPYGELITEGILAGIKNAWKNIKNWLLENIYNPMAEAWNSLVGEDSRFALPIYGEVQEVGMGSTAHVSSSGSLHGGSNGTFSLDMDGNITNLADSLSAAKKIVNGVTAGLTNAKDSIPAAQKSVGVAAKYISGALDSDKMAWGSKGRVIDVRANYISYAVANNENMAWGKPGRVIGVRANYVSYAVENNGNMAWGKPGRVIGVRANYVSYAVANNDNMAWGKPGRIIGVRANYISSQLDPQKMAWGVAGRIIATMANFTGTKNDLSESQRTFGSWANFTSYKNNLGTPSLNSDAYIKDYRIADSINYYGNLSVGAYVNIKGQTNTPTVTVNAQYTNQTKAMGGAFYNGAWHDIPQYAAGGRVHGSLFLAGEAGAEVVGHVGGRTEVLNRSQLASTMYAAVRSAMSGINIRMAAPSYSTNDDGGNEEMVYRAIVRAITDTGLDGDVELDGDVLYRKMVQYNNRNTRKTGVNAMA